ncbi:MAG: hypothetical protein FJ319_04490 [SAR202 cluster bacterium]|nr:hypothetical protein [SAR202 cluster bacterium]
MKLELREDEQVIRRAPAKGRTYRGLWCNGHIYLTNHRLICHPGWNGALLSGQKAEIVELKDVLSTEEVESKRILAVETTTGELSFHVGTSSPISGVYVNSNVAVK